MHIIKQFVQQICAERGIQQAGKEISKQRIHHSGDLAAIHLIDLHVLQEVSDRRAQRLRIRVDVFKADLHMRVLLVLGHALEKQCQHTAKVLRKLFLLLGRRVVQNKGGKLMQHGHAGIFLGNVRKERLSVLFFQRYAQRHSEFSEQLVEEIGDGKLKERTGRVVLADGRNIAARLHKVLLRTGEGVQQAMDKIRRQRVAADLSAVSADLLRVGLKELFGKALTVKRNRGSYLVRQDPHILCLVAALGMTDDRDVVVLQALNIIKSLPLCACIDGAHAVHIIRPLVFIQRAAESNDGLSVRLDKTDGFRFSRVSAVHGGTLSVNFQSTEVRIVLHALDHGCPLISARQAAVNRLIAALHQLIHNFRGKLIQQLSERVVGRKVQILPDRLSEIIVNISQVFEQEEFFY